MKDKEQRLVKSLESLNNIEFVDKEGLVLLPQDESNYLPHKTYELNENYTIREEDEDLTRTESNFLENHHKRPHHMNIRKQS